MSVDVSVVWLEYGVFCSDTLERISEYPWTLCGSIPRTRHLAYLDTPRVPNLQWGIHESLKDYRFANDDNFSGFAWCTGKDLKAFYPDGLQGMRAVIHDDHIYQFYHD